MTKKTHVYRVAGMIASIRGKKPHVYRVMILKQMADHNWRTSIDLAVIRKRVLCNILIPREINLAGHAEQGLSKTETQANTGDAFSFSLNQKNGDAT